MHMGRAGGPLVDGTAEEHLHLRIGALEDAGARDAGAPLPLELLTAASHG